MILGGPLSLLNMWIPLIVLIFTSTSTFSTSRRHLKCPCKKIHYSFRTQAIWKISYIVIHSFCNVIHSLLCAHGQVNHIIPCLSTMWKSRGTFFINCLILILSCSLIVTIFGKLIWFSLKVTLTSFQSISRVS